MKGNGCAILSYGSCWASQTVSSNNVVNVYLGGTEISAISRIVEVKTVEFNFTDGQVLEIIENRNIFTFQAFEDC